MTSSLSRLGFISLFLVTGLIGCASSPLPTFYVLSPVVPVMAKSSDAAQKTVLLERVTVADYLNRPQIVRGTQGARLLLSETARWGEPLENGIQRVLTDNLYRLGQGRLAVISQGGSQVQPVYRLSVEINRFEMDSSQIAHLGVRWRLKATADQTSRIFDQELQVKLENTEVETVVNGLNRLLAQLAGAVLVEVI